MTKSENKQRLKNEAINKIRKIYDPHRKMDYSDAEQRDYEIRDIIEELERNLK